MSTALATGSYRSERVTDQRERLGGALEEIRAMGDKLDEMREVAAERASTIRELNAHVDYLEGRIIRLEDDLQLYMRKAVSLARTIQIIWQAAEEGNRLAKAADEGEAEPEA
jgi:exonuclease VII small subunit